MTVGNTPAVSAISVAEHGLALMLAAARMLAKIDADIKSGAWRKATAAQLHGKTLGIIGLGAGCACGRTAAGGSLAAPSTE